MAYGLLSAIPKVIHLRDCRSETLIFEHLDPPRTI